MRTTCGGYLIILMTLLTAGTAPGSIIRVSPHGDKLDSTRAGETAATPDFFDDRVPAPPIHSWDERQNVRLPRDITLDITAPDIYTAPFQATASTLPRGTRINSHLIYFDPLTPATRRAIFTFSHDILGLILLSDGPADHLLLTDFLGEANTVYPDSHVEHRGVDFGPEDVIMFPDRRTLAVALTAVSPGDQIRVITRAGTSQGPPPPIPEPASGGLFIVAAGLSMLRRR